MTLSTHRPQHPRGFAASLALGAIAAGTHLVAPQASAQPFNIDPNNRESIRSFYNRVYQASEGVPIGWTGNLAACNPGTVSPAYLDATLLRVNYFRAMSGLPSNITFTEANNAKAQAAALMMSANRQLNHNPPATWTCYSQLGSDGAASNLNTGSSGPKSIDSFMQDGGDNNAVAGHRRWILLPEQLVMGSGHIPGVSDTDWQSITAALWVFGDRTPQRPAVRDEFVAWPPKGFVPFQTVYPRWSLCLSGADFNNATVTMQRNGAPVPVKIEARGGGSGEPGIVWIPNNLGHSDSWARPTADETYAVSVGNVIVGGNPRSFTYDVTIIDPLVPGPGYARAVVTGPDRPPRNQNTAYNFSAVPIATSYRWRASKLATLNLTDGAEAGLANFDAAVGDYNPVSTAVKATGNAAFRLHRSPYRNPQSLTLKRTILPNANSQVTFKSKMSLAASYSAAVQVSTDNGANWQTIYSQPGNDQTEPAFTDKVASLAAFADRMVSLRFCLLLDSGGAFISDTAGWFIDDINFVNVQELAQPPVINDIPSGTSFAFNPTDEADYALDVQAKVFGNYLEEWGPVKRVSTSSAVATAPTITTQPQSQNVVLGANVTFSVSAQSTAPLTYVWKRNAADLTDGAGIQGSRTATLTLQNVQAGSAGSYTVEVSNGNGNVTSTPAALVITEAPSLATALETTGLNWTAAGNANWFVQTTNTHDNVDAAQSGRITDSQESRMQTTINGPATLAFWWRVDSEQNYDFLRVDLDGTQQFRISGTVNWEQKTITIPAGSHTVLFAYSKDGSESRGADSGWVDQVETRQAQPPPSLGDALDATDLTWAATGDRPWFAQTATTHDSTDAAQSGPITDNQSSRLEATVLGPANLSFWWKVDSEQNYDFLTFELDGAQPASAPRISGSVNWEQKTVAIPAGTHTIRWTYSKDASVGGGADAGYVDQVVLTKLTPGEGSEPGPKLEFTASGTKLRITWPEIAVSFKLQATASLSTPNWTDVPENDISKENGEFFVIVPTTTGNRFYRLIELQ